MDLPSSWLALGFLGLAAVVLALIITALARVIAGLVSAARAARLNLPLA